MKRYLFYHVLFLLCIANAGYAYAGRKDEVSTTARVSAIPDQTAVAGKPFEFILPSDAFGGATYDTYTSSLNGGEWISFDEDPSVLTFTGRPTNTDIGTISVTVTGQSGAITQSESFTIEIQAAPQLDLDASLTSQNRDTIMTEGDPPIRILSPYVEISDLDGATLSAATVTLVGLAEEGEELSISPGDIVAANNLGIEVESYNVSTGAIKLSSSPSVTFDDYRSVLRTIFYANTSEKPVDGAFIVVQVWDSEGNVSNAALSIITMIPVNDPPSLSIDADGDHSNDEGEYETTFVEDKEAVAVTDRDVSITDIDHESGSITVSVTNPKNGEAEVLDVTGELFSGLTSRYVGRRRDQLTISGTASIAAFKSALRQIVYQNLSQDPDDTPRILTIEYSDGGLMGTVLDTTIVYIVPKNDPPSALDNVVVVAEYSRDNPFGVPSPFDVDNDLEELIMTIDSLPRLGVVTLADGVPLQVGNVLPATHFDRLQYDTPDNYDGTTPPGRMVFTVTDDSAASATNRVTFLINNAPEADDIIVTTDEDVSYTFILPDFADGYSDIEGDTLVSVIIGSLPADGSLFLRGNAVRIDDEIRVTALDSGKLVFVPRPDANGNPYTSFLFQVKDERAATSQLYVASIVVRPVSDPPTVDSVLVRGEEDEVLSFTFGDFSAQFDDPENDPLRRIKIESLPYNGKLIFGGEPVAIGDTITASDLSLLAFVPNARFHGVTEFSWNGYDGAHYAEEPAPVIIDYRERHPLFAIDDTVRLEDITVYTGSLTTQVVSPTDRPIIFSTDPVVATQHGTLTLQPNGAYTYQVDNGFVGTDAFTYEVCNETDQPQCTRATITLLIINSRLDSDLDGIPDSEEEPLVIYEGFSPDNDGINDVWRIRSIENYPNNHVRIFNRWGNLVFEVNGYNNEDRAWSSYSTTGLATGDVPDGTYFYLVDLGNGQPPRSGYVIVNR